MPGLFLLLLPVCLFCVCFVLFFLLQKNQVILFQRTEENMRGEKKTNGDAKQVDEERNRRASIFLPISSLKINTTRFNFIATRWG